MMNMLRGFAGGYTAKILIGLLIASFALWGISGSILSGTNTVVQVGDTKVDSYDYRFAYENRLLQLSQQFQTRLTREQANALGLQESVLAQVVTGAVLDENSKKMGLGLSDKNLALALASDPAFQDFSGQFSESAFANYLRQTGLSEKEFLASRKKVAMRNQIQQGTAASYDLPQAFIEAISTYENEKRVFDHVTIGPDVLDAKPEPTAEQVSEFYENNKDLFRAPEYRKVTLLVLEAGDFAKPGEVSKEDLMATYENRKNSLRSVEKRRVLQLTLKDQAEADSISEKLKNGMSFDDAVAELGKKIEDTDLGLVTPEDLPNEAVRTAAFEAELNKPTDIVKGVFGPVIINVTEIQAEKTTPFEDVEGELRNELALQKGGEEVFEMYDSIEDERAAGTSVKETAERLELKTRVLDAIDAQGSDMKGNRVSDLPVAQKLLQEIFNSEPGDDTQPLPIGNDGYVWYEVNEIIPDRQKELDEVRDEAKQAWISEETGKQVRLVAEDISTQVRNGAEFNSVLEQKLEADSLGGYVTYKTTEPINRTSKPIGLGEAAIQKGFSEKEGSVHVVENGGNSHVVLRISEVIAPEETSVEEATKSQLNAAAADDILTQVVQDFQSRESVTVNRNAMAQAFTIGRGGQY